MSKFLKYAGLMIAGGLYIWTINFLLKDDNWVGISALTTMLLAIAAFWAIWQNYSFRKEARDFHIRTQALDNIHNWANDAFKLYILSYSLDKSRKGEVIDSFTMLSIASVPIFIDAAMFETEFGNQINRADDAIKKYCSALRPEDIKVDEALKKEFVDSLTDVLTSITKFKMLEKEGEHV